MQKKQTHRPSRAKGLNERFVHRIEKHKDHIIDFTEEHRSTQQIEQAQRWLKK